jgi:hypothetical protein
MRDMLLRILIKIWVNGKSGLAMVRSHKVTSCVACQRWKELGGSKPVCVGPFSCRAWTF